ncbi:hypothetical protein P4361_08815 [Fictibacillus sp. B-59209]|nr:hypothetical protein [Fictibacillus sp. B-59209]
MSDFRGYFIILAGIYFISAGKRSISQKEVPAAAKTAPLKPVISAEEP